MWVFLGVVIGLALIVVGLSWFFAGSQHQPLRDDRPTPTPPPKQVSDKWLTSEEAGAELIRNNDGSLNFFVEHRDGALRFVSKSSGKMPAKGSPPLARLGIFYFNVRGHKYYSQVRRQVGSEVGLRREPDNPHDPRAIAVVNPSTGKIYGHVNKGYASRLYKRLDAGEDFVAIVMGAAGKHIAVMPRDIAVELDLV
ncbi:HIRAN domain-containing protein [Brevibacterium sanguinis]|uniref:HIRAN domain-containing protein n=2 Tax=Brevibacterium TaxID=1696 RepID=A0A366ILC0_9MICO|nr:MULTISPECIES: HIRAN domain-containing protein [Brevibacterium]RBP66367.1 HIRAN domain-containing protein [Brevibacterium sanguinis]RBP73018.1 HIRAN domain-containing protein [Brevibacterium celere]